MGFYDKHILPHLIDCACSTKPIMKQREKVVPRAYGCVLEVGCGSGTNFDLYNASTVDHLYALEPAAEMITKAQRAKTSLSHDKISYLEAGGEDVPLEPGSIDTVVFTFTLCTIPHWEGALQEARRVLKPDGQVLFAEHGAAPDEGVSKWQRRFEPIQKVIAGGCHLTRDPIEMLQSQGFQIAEQDAMYLPSTPKILGYNSWGVARLA